MVISAHIMGGLGNQLFIIFACISYAWENNTDFIFYDDQILHRSGVVHCDQLIGIIFYQLSNGLQQQKRYVFLAVGKNGDITM